MADPITTIAQDPGLTIVQVAALISSSAAALSSLALSAAATAAVYTAFIIKHRDDLRANTETFRVLYKEFWQTSEVAVIRRCLLNDAEYPVIQTVLSTRNQNIRNLLSTEQNDILENVDAFCAILVRVKSFTHGDLPKSRSQIWRKLLNGDLWIAEINRRQEFKKYVEDHWGELNA